MKLTEFLLARITERETAINYAYEHGLAFPVLSPAEMLADCETKRKIVGLALESLGRIESGDFEDAGLLIGRSGALFEALSLVALPYADHPDYEEWRP